MNFFRDFSDVQNRFSESHPHLPDSAIGQVGKKASLSHVEETHTGTSPCRIPLPRSDRRVLGALRRD